MVLRGNNKDYIYSSIFQINLQRTNYISILHASFLTINANTIVSNPNYVSSLTESVVNDLLAS